MEQGRLRSMTKNKTVGIGEVLSSLEFCKEWATSEWNTSMDVFSFLFIYIILPSPPQTSQRWVWSL